MSAIWEECVRYLEADSSEEDINTFVRPLLATESPPNRLSLVAPNMAMLQQVRKRFMDRIEDYLQTCQPEVSVNLVIGDGPAEAAAPVNGAAVLPQAETPSFDAVTPLLPRFTFENFVVGRSNELAYAAAQLVAQDIGSNLHNPYLIYGGVGLGKTHLMQAIGHATLQQNPDIGLAYLHCEKFVQSLISALQNKQIEQFKAFYRSVDVLLIDDIQFLAGKERSQDEFFHTFNALSDRQRQIVVTCDRYPQEIEGMEDRLKSRLGGGMNCAIEPPSPETRAAILLSKAQLQGMELPQDAAMYIAEKTFGSVRELESALQRLIMESRVKKQRIDLNFVRRSLSDLTLVRDRLLNATEIKKAVAEYYGVVEANLDSPRKPKAIVVPRQMAMKLIHELTGMSLASIGDSFGGRDHSTVLYACNKVDTLLNQGDDKTRNDYKNLKRILLT